MWTNFNNSFTVVFVDKVQKNDGIRSTASPEICCHTTLQKLNVQLCSFTARYSLQM